jgi:hypothetical protein
LTSVLVAEAPDAELIGGGYLQVRYLDRLAEAYDFLREGHQTVTYFGLAPADLSAFARGLPPLCVTRIVPVGQALDFSVVWDGYDLRLEFSQFLELR